MRQRNFRGNGLSRDSRSAFGADSAEAALLSVPSHILLVDGSAHARSTFRCMLSELGHEILEATNTSDALGLISTKHIDLVIVDQVAPDLGAYEFCRVLKRSAATKFVPIYIVAESDDVESEVLGIDSGADEFIVKPLRPKAFRARVQASLRQKALVDSLDDSEAVLFSLAQSVEERDPAIGTHCQRLAMMATAMGITLGLPAPDILALQRSGYLHDIGKVAIPDRILFKAGPLTPDEWEIMRSHAERGEKICSSMKSLEPVLPIIRHHHEKWDGTGYPDKLRGEQIPLLARILQIADIYDALTAERPYKQAFSSEKAMAILREESAKGWRDPQLLEMFSDILPMFRNAGAADLTRESLQALALSVEQYRKNANRSPSNTVWSGFGDIRLVSGL